MKPDNYTTLDPSQTEPANDSWLTVEDVMGLTGLTKRTLVEYRTARQRHYGPPFHRHTRRPDGSRIKGGSCVRYLRSEVLEWMGTRI